MSEKKITEREKMLQWSVITLFCGMVLFAGSTQIVHDFWKGFTIILAAVLFLSGIWELKNYYKKEKYNK